MKIKVLKFPSLCIKGSLSELMEIETLMILLGYVSDESWNRSQFNRNTWVTDKPFIELHDEKDGGYGYFSHPFGTNSKTFRVDQVSQMLAYIESYQNKN